MQIPSQIHDRRKISPKDFRKQVILGLLEGHSRTPPEVRRGKQSTTLNLPLVNRLHERHFPMAFTNLNGKHRPECVVCSIRKCKKGKKGPCKRHQTTFYCDDCQGKPAMCVQNVNGQNCFRIYHTLKSYRDKCDCIV